jgi:hypothetical protein
LLRWNLSCAFASAKQPACGINQATHAAGAGIAAAGWNWQTCAASVIVASRVNRTTLALETEYFFAT